MIITARLSIFFFVFFSCLGAVADPSKHLWTAAKEGKLNDCKVALKKNADVNFFGKDGSTPLWQAAANGKTKIVRLLLEAGANPMLWPQNLRGLVSPRKAQNRVTKLSPRQWMGHTSHSHEALPNPADLSSPKSGSKRKKKSDPIKESGNVGVPLLDLPSSDKSPYDLGLPIHVAIQNGHLKVITALLEVGDTRQIEAVDRKRNNPVHLACATQNLAIFKAVIRPCRPKSRAWFNAQLRTAVNASNQKGLTPLHIVIKHAGPDIFFKGKALIEAGSVIDAKTIDSRKLSVVELAFKELSFANNIYDKASAQALSYLILLLAMKGASLPKLIECPLAARLVAHMFKANQNAIAKAIMPSDSEAYEREEDDRDPFAIALSNLSLGSELSLQHEDAKDNLDGALRHLGEHFSARAILNASTAEKGDSENDIEKLLRELEILSVRGSQERSEQTESKSDYETDDFIFEADQHEIKTKAGVH